MIQRARQCTIAAGRARVLVLLAVLVLSGSPALEAIHDHTSGTAYSDCLLCKQAETLAVPCIAHPSLAHGSSPMVAASLRPWTRVQQYQAFSPIVPPSNS